MVDAWLEGRRHAPVLLEVPLCSRSGAKYMASKKPLSATADKSAADLRKLAEPVGTQNFAKHIADVFSNFGKGKPFLSATDLAEALSQIDGAANFVTRPSEPTPTIDLQLPDMSQGVRVSLPNPIQDSYQPQNGDTGTEKAMVPPANRGADVEEL